MYVWFNVLPYLTLPRPALRFPLWDQNTHADLLARPELVRPPSCLEGEATSTATCFPAGVEEGQEG